MKSITFFDLPTLSRMPFIIKGQTRPGPPPLAARRRPGCDFDERLLPHRDAIRDVFGNRVSHESGERERALACFQA
jgi:hypothetical protein